MEKNGAAKKLVLNRETVKNLQVKTSLRTGALNTESGSGCTACCNGSSRPMTDWC